MNLFQRIRLIRNYNNINRMIFKSNEDAKEALDLLLSRGIDPLMIYNQRIRNLPTYRDELIKLDSFEAKKILLAISPEDLTEDQRPIVLNQLRSLDFKVTASRGISTADEKNLVSINYISKEYLADFEFLENLSEKDPDFFRNLDIYPYLYENSFPQIEKAGKSFELAKLFFKNGRTIDSMVYSEYDINKLNTYLTVNPTYTLSDKMIDSFLRLDFGTTFQSEFFKREMVVRKESSFFQEGPKEPRIDTNRVKEIFFSNLPENIEYLSSFMDYFKEEQLSEEEKEKLLKIVKEKKIAIRQDQDKIYSFFYKDHEVMANSLSQNIETIEDFPIIGLTEYLPTLEFTDEEIEAISNNFLKIDRKILLENQFWRQFVSEDCDRKIYNNILRKNPYYFDDFSYLYYNQQENIEFLTKNYTLTDHSPNNFATSPELIIASLQRGVNSTASLTNNRYTYIRFSDEQLRQVYSIVKSDEYEYSFEDSPNYLKFNPYLFMDALREGKIDITTLGPNSNIDEIIGYEQLKDDLYQYYCLHYDDIQNSKFAARFNHQFERTRELALGNRSSRDLSLDERLAFKDFSNSFRLSTRDALELSKENPYYIYKAYGFSSENLSKEEQQEFVNIVTSNISNLNYNVLDFSRLNSNIYLYKYLYENDITSDQILIDTMTTALQEFADEEYFSEIKRIYEEKGENFSKSSQNLILLNPLIILDEIEKNPQSIDSLIGILPYRQDEIRAKIIEKIDDGSYQLSSDTPEFLRRDDAFVDFILEKDPKNIKYIEPSYFYHKDGSYDKVFSALQNGTLEFDKENPLKFRPLSPIELQRLIDINPNAVDYINSNGLTNEKNVEFMLDKILSGEYIVGENSGEFVTSVISHCIFNYNEDYSNEVNDPQRAQLIHRMYEKTMNLKSIAKDNPYLELAMLSGIGPYSEPKEAEEILLDLTPHILGGNIKLSNVDLATTFLGQFGQFPEIRKNFIESNPDLMLQNADSLRTAINNELFASTGSVEHSYDFQDISDEFIDNLANQIIERGYNENSTSLLLNSKRFFMAVVKKDPSVIEYLENNVKDSSKYSLEFNEEDYLNLEEILRSNNINYVITKKSLAVFKKSPEYVLKSLRQNFDSLQYMTEAIPADTIIQNKALFNRLMNILDKNGIRPNEHGALPDVLVPLFSKFEGKRLYSKSSQFYNKPSYYDYSYQDRLNRRTSREDFVLQATDDDLIRSNPKAIMKSIRNDWSTIDLISPLLDNARNSFSQEDMEYIVSQAKENGYVLNENTPFFLRQNFDIVMNSLSINPQTLSLVAPNIYLKEAEQNQILKIALNSKNHFTLANLKIDFLKSNIDFIHKSLLEAKPEEIQTIFENINPVAFNENEMNEFSNRFLQEIRDGNIDLQKFKNPELLKNDYFVRNVASVDLRILLNDDIDVERFPIEDQRRFYASLSQIDFEDETQKSLLEEKLHTTQIKVFEDIVAHPENIDKYNFDYVVVPKDIRNQVVENLLQIEDYQVSENTPFFIRNSPEFVYQYLKRNDGKLNGLNLADVAVILDLDQVREHKEYLEFSDYYNKIKVNYYEYFDVLGIEQTIEVLDKIGPLIKKLSPEDIKKSNFSDLETMFVANLNMPNNGYNLEELNAIIEKFNITITPEILENNSILKEDSHLFLRQIEFDPNLVVLYAGVDEAVFKKAKEKGFKFDKENSFSKSNFMGSSIIINSLLDDNVPDAEISYLGRDEQVFKRFLDEGRLDTYSEEKLVDFFKHSSISSYDDASKYIIDKFGADKIVLYSGRNQEIYQYAVNKGFKIGIDLFLERPDLIGNSQLIEDGIKNDKLVLALKLYNGLNISNNIVNVDETREMRIIKEYFGEENLSKYFKTPEDRMELYRMFSLASQNSNNAVKIFRVLKPDILEATGFQEWKKFIKYTIETPEFENIVKIAENNQFKSFIDSYKVIDSIIEDNKGVGVNKYIKYAKLYSINPKLCEDFTKMLSPEEIKSGEISEEHLGIYSDFKTLMYSPIREDDIAKLDVSILGKLTEEKRSKGLALLDNPNATSEDIKNSLLDYLFNENVTDVGDILAKNINSKTLMEIQERSKREGKQELGIKSMELGIFIDLIEQVYYSDADVSELKEFAKNIFSKDIKDIKKIRTNFGNLRESIRDFYELEANEELTNIDNMITTRPELVEELSDGHKILDLTKSKHTLYAHVLSGTVEGFFTRDRGYVTICVSPETDLHEAYYGGGYGRGVTFGFDKVPRGGFIGGSVLNMGSNGSITDNNYQTENVEHSFDERSIRSSYSESYGGSGHGETLLYRAGLVPSCLILIGETPTDAELEAARQVEKYINKGLEPTDPNYKKLPFVRTQKHKNRVINYDKNDSRRADLVQDVDEIENPFEASMETLRQKFIGMLGFGNQRQFIKKDKLRDEQYIIQDGKVFILDSKFESATYQQVPIDQVQDNLTLASELSLTANHLQNIIYGDKTRAREIIVLEGTDKSTGDKIYTTAKEQVPRKNTLAI